MSNIQQTTDFLNNLLERLQLAAGNAEHRDQEGNIDSGTSPLPIVSNESQAVSCAEDTVSSTWSEFPAQPPPLARNPDQSTTRAGARASPPVRPGTFDRREYFSQQKVIKSERFKQKWGWLLPKCHLCGYRLEPGEKCPNEDKHYLVQKKTNGRS